MAIIKYIAVHLSPLKCIRYILNGSKTDEMRFVTGLQCTPNAKAAYMGMSANFENFSDERFYKKSFKYLETVFASYLVPVTSIDIPKGD